MSIATGADPVWGSDVICCIDPASVESNIGNRSLIRWDYWTAGTGSATNYPATGLTSENTRLLDTDPWGNSSMVWKGTTDGLNSADGGWDMGGSAIAADPTKLYRFSVWARRISATTTGTSYFGLHTNGTGDTFDLSTSASQTNPYWHYIGIGGLVLNQWYLYVGHLFPHTWTGTTAHAESGVYSTTTKLSGLGGNVPNDVKFPSNATAMGHRAFFYYGTDATSAIEMFQPRIDLKDGTEPTIAQLQNNCGSTITDLMGISSGVGVRRFPPVVIDGAVNCFDFSSNVGLNATSALVGLVFSSPIPALASFTFNTWVKNVPAAVGQGLLYSNTADNNGFRFGIGADGVYYLIGPTYLEGQINWVGGFTNTQWNHVCVVFDRFGSTTSGAPKVLVYLNGVLNSSVSINATQTAFTTVGYTNAYMAAGLGSFATYSGKLGQFSIYSRALLPDEVKQNFYALRGRYGI